jgi:predicted  nucleic acid-binding Zn-ribbon protein
VRKLNKTIQDLKGKLKQKKKTQNKTTLEIETPGKKSRTIDASISNRIKKIEERISGAEGSI